MIWTVVVTALLGFMAHTVPFPFLLERFAPARALWRVDPSHGTAAVYLTFDDGPNPTATPELLDVLLATDARATFFLIDAHITDETAWLVRRMFDEGHGVALHSDTRALMTMSPDELAERLTNQADRIRELAGTAPCRLFRPHAGWRSGSMYAALRRLDYRLVGWSFGMWDFNWYRRPDPSALATRLARRASSGDIVVMHDGHHLDARPDRRHTVEAVRQLVPRLRARGFAVAALCHPRTAAASSEAASRTVNRPGHELPSTM